MSLEIQNIRTRFLEDIEKSAELDDPLAVHVEYIQKLKAEGHTSEFVLEALERTTQTFIEDPRYRSDPRYLHVWLDYAARCREPEDVFAFLAMKEACLDLAAYYEEYAGYLEKRKITAAGTVEKICKIYERGIGRQARPFERLKKFYQEFLQKYCQTPQESKAVDEKYKRQSWSNIPSAPTSHIMANSWTKSTGLRGRPIEVHGYKSVLLEDSQFCFEEVRAKAYLSIQRPRPKNFKSSVLNVINVSDEMDDDLDDVPSLAVAVNPEDLTHISVYRDNTADLKELTRLAATHKDSKLGPLAIPNDKENNAFSPSLVPPPQDISMAEAPPLADEFEPIDTNKMGCKGCFGTLPFERGNQRLSLIPEEPELTSTFSIRSTRPTSKASSEVKPVFNSITLDTEIRLKMESMMNPGIIMDLLVVHESALAKVRLLEKSVGRDGTGPNQTISALKIANGHFFIEKRLGSGCKNYLAVDLESDVSCGSNQWRLKVSSPPSFWEPYTIARLSALSSPRFPTLKLCCHYNDACFFASTYYEQGTLQRALDILQGKPDELLALFYTYELLKILAGLIDVGIVHGRITLDHLMTRSTDMNNFWASQYQADGSFGWSGKGLALIGYSKAIDLALLEKMSFVHHQDHRIDFEGVKGVILALVDLSEPRNFYSIWQQIISVLSAPYNLNTSRTLLGNLIDQVDSILVGASMNSIPTLKSSLTKLELLLLDSGK